MKTLREISAWLLIAAPYIYLASIWSALPEKVATHFNSSGPDGWSSRQSLLLVPSVLPLSIYVLMFLIPFIDPKGKLREMGVKLQILKLMLTFFMSALACYIIHSSFKGALVVPQILFLILGLLFAALGNYFQAVRPNYFIGIRTPWTLESEEVWRLTHRLGGRLWIAGGLLLVLLSFVVNTTVMESLLAWVVTPLALIPIVYSFVIFRQKKNKLPESNN